MRLAIQDIDREYVWSQEYNGVILTTNIVGWMPREYKSRHSQW